MKLEDLLVRLRTGAVKPPQPTPLPAPPDVDLCEVEAGADLPALFAETAEAAGCRVWRAGGQTWVDTVRQILRDLAAKSVLIEAQPGTALTPERYRVLTAGVAGDGIRVLTAPDDETLFSVDAAITGVRSAIAETGTLVCVSGESSARGASLIPPVHIAVVENTQIVADLFDFFACVGCVDSAGKEFTTSPQLVGSAHPTLPANVNLITGPSKTADIESVLVTGMHGPGTVHVVLLGS